MLGYFFIAQPEVAICWITCEHLTILFACRGKKGVGTFLWRPVVCLVVALLPCKVASVDEQMCGQSGIAVERVLHITF